MTDINWSRIQLFFWFSHMKDVKENFTSHHISLHHSDNITNHKNYNFLNCNWLKKLLFFTNLLAKLLSDSSISQSHSQL